MNTLWFIAALLVPFIWGIQAVMLKFGIGQFPPIFMVSLRFLIMFICLAPFLMRLKGQFLHASTIGLTQGVAHFALLYIGFKYADVTSGMIVYQTNTIFTLILGSLILGERLTKYGFIGTFVCLIGVSFILGLPQENTSIAGLAIIACSAFMFAVGNIFVRKLGPFDPIGLNATVSMIAFPALLALSFTIEENQIQSMLEATPLAWGALLYTALLGGILAFILWYKLLGKFSIDKVSPFSLLMPFFAMLGSVVLLNEEITWSNGVGALITVGGIIIIQYGEKFMTRKQTPAPQEVMQN